MGDDEAWNGRNWDVCTVVSERRIGGNGADVRRIRSGEWVKWGKGWEETDRLYGVVGENSIDFRKILYRLFRKTL